MKGLTLIALALVFVVVVFTEGSRGEVKCLIFRKSCCTQFDRLLEYQVKLNKSRYFLLKGGKIFSLPIDYCNQICVLYGGETVGNRYHTSTL